MTQQTSNHKIKQQFKSKIQFHSFLSSVLFSVLLIVLSVRCLCWYVFFLLSPIVFDDVKRINKREKNVQIFYDVGILSSGNSHLTIQQPILAATTTLSPHKLSCSLCLFSTHAHTMYKQQTRQGSKRKKNNMVKVTRIQS